MAIATPTTRRTLFAIAGALAASPAVVLAPPALSTPQRDLVKAIGFLFGRRGEDAALRAVEAGMSFDDLFSVVNLGSDHPNHPILHYRLSTGALRSFTPMGEMH